ncbi:omptin family outer membrane protease [Yersinia hibernica]|uniref:Omptin family outer membrane protease n=1 Tax=Yersinia hibernica TaxID=2339259 RepID=A0ABX5QYT2_9GAMM|nr:omptin family outer membrane protease [Yersinia hibernica]
MITKGIFVVFGVFSVTLPALADDNIHLDSKSIKTSVGLGMLGGESKEYVYDSDSGQKISQLNWKIKNTAIIKGDISWDAFNWLTLNARGWTSLASGSSGMDDYDWLIPGQTNWSHWSNHPNTQLNHANEFDVNVKGWILNTPEYRIGTIFGYQQTRFSWAASGGSYSYNNGATTGVSPPNSPGIGYNQQFSMPYLGLASIYRYQDFEFNALLKFSPWVTANDNDEHYRRNLTFREKTNNSRYYSVTVDAGYYVTPNAKVYTELSLSKYEEGKGGTEIINRATGEKAYLGGDAAGIENMNYTVSIGMQYQF